VIQVVTVTREDTVTADTANTPVTAITLNITPSSSSNTILLMCNGGDLDGQVSGRQIVCGFFRGSTSLANNTNLHTNAYSESGGRIIVPISMTYRDSPATTSQITYYVKFSPTGNNLVQFNSQSGIVTFTAMEIAG